MEKPDRVEQQAAEAQPVSEPRRCNYRDESGAACNLTVEEHDYAERFQQRYGGRLYHRFTGVVDPVSEPCPVCNDEGVVHTHEGIPTGPCDCCAPARESVQPFDILADINALIDIVRAHGIWYAVRDRIVAAFAEQQRRLKIALEDAAVMKANWNAACGDIDDQQRTIDGMKQAYADHDLAQEATIAEQAERIQKLEARERELLEVINANHSRRGSQCCCVYCEKLLAGEEGKHV